MENWLSEMERSSAVSFASVVELLQLRGLSPDCGGVDDGTVLLWLILASLSGKRPGSVSRRGMLAWTGPGHLGEIAVDCFVIQFISSPETQ